MGRVAFFIILLVYLWWPTALAALPFNSPELTGGFMTVVDESGAVIFQTGLAVHPGDQYINEDNRLYEVTSVEGTLAKARFVRDELWTSGEAVPTQAPVVPEGGPVPTPAPPEGGQTPEPQLAPAPPASQQLIAVYYTHNDESYVPTDGKTTIRGNGGIFKVGAAFSQRLTELGYAVDNNQTRHDPHDANAYQRSRRTFKRLLELGPAALFDIHRDSAPLSAYKTTINGQPAAKMMLVVGRQNQNRQTSLNYAQRIKAAADSKYKGLVRGIFMAHGNYNQDLNPRAMLLEVGTEYNTREEAERTAALFADVVPLFLAPSVGVAAGPASPGGQFSTSPPDNYGRDTLSILGVLVAGVAGYLFISTGSWREARHKLAKFRKYEFTNFLGPRKKRKD